MLAHPSRRDSRTRVPLAMGKEVEVCWLSLDWVNAFRTCEFLPVVKRCEFTPNPFKLFRSCTVIGPESYEHAEHDAMQAMAVLAVAGSAFAAVLIGLCVAGRPRKPHTRKHVMEAHLEAHQQHGKVVPLVDSSASANKLKRSPSSISPSKKPHHRKHVMVAHEELAELPRPSPATHTRAKISPPTKAKK